MPGTASDSKLIGHSSDHFFRGTYHFRLTDCQIRLGTTTAQRFATMSVVLRGGLPRTGHSSLPRMRVSSHLSESQPSGIFSGILSGQTFEKAL